MKISPEERQSFLTQIDAHRREIQFYRDVAEYVKKNPVPDLYWDYNGHSFSSKDISDIITYGPEGLFKVKDRLWLENIDLLTDIEEEYIDDMISVFVIKAAELGLNYDEEYIRDVCRDSVFSDVNIEDLARITPDENIRIHWLSNFECLELLPVNYSAYLKQIIDLLCLNPQKIKHEWSRHTSDKLNGSWPNFKWRNGKEYVDYDDFVIELLNTHNDSDNLFTFMAKINVHNLICNPELLCKISIPAGNHCGIFNHSIGGGSLMSMTLKRDFVIDLSWRGKSEYDKFDIGTDLFNNYSIEETYGFIKSYWGKTITFF